MLLALSAHAVISDRLSPHLAGQPTRFLARVADFPKLNAASLTFVAEPVGRDDLPRRIRLSWYDTDARPAPGETWQFEARLRRPRGLSNPAGFDYEAWLFRQGIGATGYVIDNAVNARQDGRPVDRISRLRQRFVRRIEMRWPDDDAAAVVVAVAVGARHKITRQQWQRYAATGTSHLMAISGLHIGLAAGAVFLLCWFLLSFFCRRANIRDVAAIVAALTALAYAEVSGFAVPARRALLMTIVVVIAALRRRQLSPARLLASCCLAILVAEPLAVLAPGFKLSFTAVAILFWHLRVTRIPARTPRRRFLGLLLHGAGRLSSTQTALLFGLLPLTALLFQRVTLLAPFVNILALPVFNFVTVPASLLGLLLDGPLRAAGDIALGVAHGSVGVVLWLIRCTAELPYTNFHVAQPQGWLVAVVFLPSLMCLAPPGWPGRRLGLVAALAVILERPAAPPAACFDLQVLDAGQGLALVLRTPRHVAVFDTGPSFRGGSDTGQLVLLPYLRGEGIRSVDSLIVSHADQDHAGGVESLLQGVNVDRIWSGEAVDAGGRPPQPCLAGGSWRWDGIVFEFLHPQHAGRWHGNNASCVLQVRAGSQRIVLTGDIEAPVERRLADSGVLRPADIVLVPHHGSRTSSSDGFITSLRPKVAIVSAGYDNRWGFPKADIVDSWRRAGATVLNTAISGAIGYRICADRGIRRLSEQRLDHRRYWHDYSGY